MLPPASRAVSHPRSLNVICNYRLFRMVFIFLLLVIVHTIFGQTPKPGPRVIAQAGPVAETEVMRRANALLAQMTLEEKVGQMTQLFFGIVPDQVKVEDRVRRGEIGSLLFVTDPATINRLQKVAVEESRLKIPLLLGFDVIHGFHTIFPIPLAMAASWDPEMVEQAQSIAAREARSV